MDRVISKVKENDDQSFIVASLQASTRQSCRVEGCP